jgi:hypothetical protein
MAEFKSIYGGLTFYVDDKAYKFRNGKFKTKDSKVIKAVEKLNGVERVDKEDSTKSKVAEMFEEKKPKTKEKTAPKDKK